MTQYFFQCSDRLTNEVRQTALHIAATWLKGESDSYWSDLLAVAEILEAWLNRPDGQSRVDWLDEHPRWDTTPVEERR